MTLSQRGQMTSACNNCTPGSTTDHVLCALPLPWFCQWPLIELPLPTALGGRRSGRGGGGVGWGSAFLWGSSADALAGRDVDFARLPCFPLLSCRAWPFSVGFQQYVISSPILLDGALATRLCEKEQYVNMLTSCVHACTFGGKMTNTKHVLCGSRGCSD